MIIALLGLSHKTAPVELRERLHVSEEELTNFLQLLKQAVPEGMLYSTCNRFEILSHQNDLETARDTLIEAISKMRGIERQVFESHLYYHVGPEAVRHIFRVTSSLDSLVVGEPQILGQMKQFFAAAQKEETIGLTLKLILERAFAVAKKVRTETTIAENPVSVGSVAVELANKIFGDLEGKTALILGAGKMGLLSVRHLRSRGVRKLIIINRTFHKAADLAEQIKGHAAPLEALGECLAESDIVISSTGSQHFLINREDAQRAISLRKNRPIFFIDIGVPRDVDPEVNQLDNVFLYDIDDLKIVMDKNLKEREKEAEKAEEMIAREAESFWNRLKELDIAPTIREIQARLDAMRAAEVDRTLKKLGPLNDEQRQAIEQLASSLTSKISQSSFSELRQLANQPDGIEKIELIKKLFRL